MSKLGELNISIQDIEGLLTDAEKIDSMNEVIFQALYVGNNDPSIYEWVHVAFREMTFEYRNKLKNLVKEVYKTAK